MNPCNGQNPECLTMKTPSSIITSLTGAGLLAAALFASVEQNAAAAAPSVDPVHAAHVAEGAMPPDAPAVDPALMRQLSALQAKVTQLQASLAKSAPPPMAAMPGMPAAAPAPAPPMAMGMGKMKPGGMPGMSPGAAAAPPTPGTGGAGMMGMMSNMMGMMDKMMGMGAPPPPAPAAPMPAAAMPMGDDAMEMGAMPPAAPMPGAAMPMGDDAMEMGAMPPAAPMPGGAMPMGDDAMEMGAMPPAAPMPGGAMPMGDDAMEMAGMMGMSPMGGAPGAMPRSALPGFPGSSHIYHIGATGFFLDHPQHLVLTLAQQVGLNQAKQQAIFLKSTAELASEQAEQELWMLTAADQPDAAQIEAKIRELEKLRGDARLAFIHAVGEASKLLTDEQRKTLTGLAPSAPALPMAPPAAPMPAGGMPDM